MKDYPKNFESIRWLVEGYYDIQKLRIQAFNRLNKKCLKCQKKDKLTFRKKKKEWYCNRCKRKVPTITTEKELEDYYLKLQTTEDDLNKTLKNWVKQFPIYTDYLEGIRGIGHILSAGLIAWIFPIERFPNVSKLWRYCGLAVIKGQAERRKKGEKIHYNPKLKTFCWKIGSSFIKQNAKKSGYRRFYNKFKEHYREREKNKKYKKGSKKMHVHLMALRRTVKLFLSHFWEVSRKIDGLEVTKPYPLKILGHDTHILPFSDLTEKEELIKRGLE